MLGLQMQHQSYLCAAQGEGRQGVTLGLLQYAISEALVSELLGLEAL